MSEIVLSRKADEFVGRNRWIASLSSGETIFEDTRKNEPPAWKRLGDYCRENSLAITKLRIQFGHLEVDIPANALGYVAKKKFISSCGISQLLWGCGHIDEHGQTLLHYIAPDGTSFTRIEADPGEPYAIYDYREVA